MAAEHGTRSRYTHDKCRCAACRKANADHCRRWRRQHAQLLAEGLEVPHGLYSTYVHYKCRCAACTAASTSWHRQRKVQRRREVAERFGDLEHGSASTYKNWGCRCGPCTDANTAYSAPYRAAYNARQRALRNLEGRPA